MKLLLFLFGLWVGASIGFLFGTWWAGRRWNGSPDVTIGVVGVVEPNEDTNEDTNTTDYWQDHAHPN